MYGDMLYFIVFFKYKEKEYFIFIYIYFIFFMGGRGLEN